jgi:hypothetical protein
MGRMTNMSKVMVGKHEVKIKLERLRRKITGNIKTDLGE